VSIAIINRLCDKCYDHKEASILTISSVIENSIIDLKPEHYDNGNIEHITLCIVAMIGFRYPGRADYPLYQLRWLINHYEKVDSYYDSYRGLESYYDVTWSFDDKYDVNVIYW
jgi:hypothetical protein